MLGPCSPVLIMSSRRNTFHFTSHHCVVLLAPRHLTGLRIAWLSNIILPEQCPLPHCAEAHVLPYPRKSKLLFLSSSILTRSLRLSRISLFSTRTRAQIPALFICFSAYHLTTSNLEPYDSSESLGYVPYLSSAPPHVNSSCAPE